MFRPQRHSLSLLTVLSLALSLAACGDEEETTDDSGNTTDTGGNGGDAGGADCTTPASTHADQTYRVLTVDILQPGGIGDILQGLIQADIDDQLLHILVRTQAFGADCGATTFELTGNAGQLTDAGTYDWFQIPGEGSAYVEVNYKPATIEDNGDFVNTEDLSLIFPALNPADGSVLQIPVDNIGLVGRLTGIDGGARLEGQLSGVIFEDQIAGIDNIQITPGAEPQNLASLLGESNKDFVEDGTGRVGWTLQANITAETVTAVDGIQ